MLLAVDQGTTNTKALLIDRDGSTHFRAGANAPLRTSSRGEIDQDPSAILASALQVIEASAEWARSAGKTISGLCLTNQRETAVAWDRETGEPLGPAISWQCRRSAPVCAAVRQHAASLQQTTGLPLDPLLSATKWTWMLENVPEVQQAAQRGTLALGTVDSWLVSRLTREAAHLTDTTNASRTGLLSLSTIAWDEALLPLFGLRREWMPMLQPSASHFGTARPELGIGEVPVVAVAGDSHAAMLGHGDLRPGATKATYGTGSSLMAITGELASSTEHLSRTIAWTLPSEDLRSSTQYALEGNITMSGAALEWVGTFLGLKEAAADAALLAEQVPDSAGLAFVPAMAGLGAPHWSAHARGTITGLQSHHRPAHLARAALEAIAMQVADVVEAMRCECAVGLTQLLADGGATRNASLMQLQAEALGIPVLRSTQEELSALGVARLGGLTLGWWPDLASAHALDRKTDAFVPKSSDGDREAKRSAWKTALRRTLLEVTQ